MPQTGIGFELAKCFANDGHALVIVANDGPELERAATELREAGAPKVDALGIDLAEASAAQHVYDVVAQLGSRPNTSSIMRAPALKVTSRVKPTSPPNWRSLRSIQLRLSS